MNLTDSIVRCRSRQGLDREVFLNPGEPVEVTIEPQAVANVFGRGHRIRLDVSSSNFPRFDVNPNTGEPSGRESRVETATNAVYVEAARPSRVTFTALRRSFG